MQKRSADLAGSWYSADPERLAGEVDACLAEAERKYGRPASEPRGAPLAIVVPHAGLAYSGAIAAIAFQLVRDRLGRVDTFLVFGACHRARLSRPAIWNEGPWQTPLGDIEIDHDLGGLLIARGVGVDNPVPHLGDNAIELQTPFIKRLFPEARMTPIAMAFFDDAWQIGETAAAAAAETGRTVVAVASTDLTHYGSAFGVTPAGRGKPALKWTRRNDERFLDALVAMEKDKIVPVAKRDGSACGAGGAAAAGGWAHALGARAGRLLAHANSHEIMPRGEAEHIVGYASLAYLKELSE